MKFENSKNSHNYKNIKSKIQDCGNLREGCVGGALGVGRGGRKDGQNKGFDAQETGWREDTGL